MGILARAAVSQLKDTEIELGAMTVTRCAQFHHGLPDPAARRADGVT